MSAASLCSTGPPPHVRRAGQLDLLCAKFGEGYQGRGPGEPGSGVRSPSSKPQPRSPAAPRPRGPASSAMLHKPDHGMQNLGREPDHGRSRPADEREGEWPESLLLGRTVDTRFPSAGSVLA